MHVEGLVTRIVFPRPAGRDVERVDRGVSRAVLQRDDQILLTGAELRSVCKVDGDLFPQSQTAVVAHQENITKEAELIPQSGAAIDPRKHRIRDGARVSGQVLTGPFIALVALFEKSVQCAGGVAEAVQDATRVLLAIEDLGQRPGEEKIRHVRRLPRGR